MSTDTTLEPVKGPRTLGVTQILSKKYKTLEISETVVLVRDFIAESRGRYGPTEPYTIWDKRKPKQGDQLKLEIQS